MLEYPNVELRVDRWALGLDHMRLLAAFEREDSKYCADADYSDVNPHGHSMAFCNWMSTLVRTIRQACYLFYKLEVGYANSVIDEVLEKFIQTDQELPDEGTSLWLSPRTNTALENAYYALVCLLRGFDPGEIVPQHGPGSVSTGETGPEKYAFRRFYSQLDSFFNYPDYFFYSVSHLVDEMEKLEALTCVDEPMARVELVPKDSRVPALFP
jgi:hypothetical protein